MFLKRTIIFLTFANELFSKNFWFFKKCLLTPQKSQKITQSSANERGLVVGLYKYAVPGRKRSILSEQ